MSLKSLVKKEVLSVMEFPNHDTFKVTLRYLDKELMKDVFEKCSKTKLDWKTKEQKKTLDKDKLQAYIAENIIVKWEGLTYHILSKIAPITIPVDVTADTLIESTLENKKDVLEISNDFDSWVAEVMKEYEYFDNDKKKEEVENIK